MIVYPCFNEMCYKGTALYMQTHGVMHLAYPTLKLSMLLHKRLGCNLLYFLFMFQMLTIFLAFSSSILIYKIVQRINNGVSDLTSSV